MVGQLVKEDEKEDNDQHTTQTGGGREREYRDGGREGLGAWRGGEWQGREGKKEKKMTHSHSHCYCLEHNTMFTLFSMVINFQKIFELTSLRPAISCR